MLTITRQAETLWKAGDLSAALSKYVQLRESTGSAAWNYQISRIERLLHGGAAAPRLQDFANILLSQAGIEKVYVVNLPHRQDRKARILKELSIAGFETSQIQFIAGVHGDSDPVAIRLNNCFKSSPNPESLYGLSLSAQKLTYDKAHSTPGVFGYLLSQDLVFRDALKNGYGRIAVFDDDVFFPVCAAQTLRRFLSKVSDWKILLLGATNYFERGFDQKESFFSSAEAMGYHAPIPMVTCGSFAVCYDKSIYSCILNLINDFSGYYDRHILASLYNAQPGDCYAVWPPVCCADVEDSEIRGNRDIIKHAKLARWDVSRYREYKNNT
jgi:hypothetical protein